MFHGAIHLTKTIGSWNTSSVTTMPHVLCATSFNGAIGSWDTSSVTSMTLYVLDATAFNQALLAAGIPAQSQHGQCSMRASFNGAIGSWDTSSVTNMSNVSKRLHLMALLAAGIPAQSQT